MTRFLLVRHAEHTGQGQALAGRSPGFGLSDLGKAQAAALARALAPERPALVVASPQERAHATAAALALVAELQVETDQALDEIDYGSWTGSRPADLEGDSLWQAWNSLRATHRVPGGESMHEVQARMVAASERLARRLPEATCALVSHQDPLRALLVHWLGMPLDFLLRLDLAPGSLTTIDLQGGWPRLVNLNIRF